VKTKEDFLPLPKAFKIKSSHIDFLSMTRSISHHIEKKKKPTVIPAIEQNLATLSKGTNPSNNAELIKYFVASMKDRQTLISFYHGKYMIRRVEQWK